MRHSKLNAVVALVALAALVFATGTFRFLHHQDEVRSGLSRATSADHGPNYDAPDLVPATPNAVVAVTMPVCGHVDRVECAVPSLCSIPQVTIRPPPFSPSIIVSL